jgi:hypothetical protein
MGDPFTRNPAGVILCMKNSHKLRTLTCFFIQFFVFLYLAIFTSPVKATITEGENLLINGCLKAEQLDFPEFWSPSTVKHVFYRRFGGPKAEQASIVLKSDGAVPGIVSARQIGMVLTAGETYRLSAYIKTKGYKSRHGGLVVHNSGWRKAVGFTELPTDSGWTFMEKTFTLFPSKNKEYGLSMYARNLTGEIHFSDLRLEALSEGAQQGSYSHRWVVANPRLVPIQPLLSKIPRAHPELIFKLCGTLPEKPEAYECIVTIAENLIPKQITMVKEGKILVKLAHLPCGDYSLKAVLRHRETHETILEAFYPISVIDIPTIDRSKIKQLNNLVAEVLNKPVNTNTVPESFTFVNPRDGWVFIAITTNEPQQGLKVVLDDHDTVITAATDRLEAFRKLSMGEHHITISCNSNDSRLIVRSIPEILDYPPCTDSIVKENGSYGWDFMKEHILHAVTTFNGGTMPEEVLRESESLGLKWLANFSVAPLDDPADIRDRMEKHYGMVKMHYDGLTIDELFFNRITIDNYTKALRFVHNPENRLIYTWVTGGKPNIPCLHTDFISACLNASMGRGRLLLEAYCRSMANEKAAAAYLDRKIGETMRRLNALFPIVGAGTGIIFGNFNQIPIITLESNPAVDFKYYLDMQVNLVANSTDFKNLATVGFWGTHYSDEELVRWSFKLMRHYAIEGNRDMLSTRYGFRYNPGFLTNGDFSEGLKEWISLPAAEGSIRTGTIAGYGKNSQRRWESGEAGDTVCIMTRKADEPNRICQTVNDLDVGKAYCLQFVTADFRDVTGKKYNPRRYGIDVDLAGVEILGDKSFVHIDRRNKGRHKYNKDIGMINLNRIIFRAKSPRQVISFNDEKAIPGEELMINFIQIKPYFE